MPSAITATAAIPNDLWRARIRAPYRRSRSRCITGFDGRALPAVGGGLGLPETSAFQLHQLVRVCRLVAARANVVDESRRNAMVPKPDDLRERQILQAELLHVGDVVGAHTVILGADDVVERNVLESLGAQIAHER